MNKEESTIDRFVGKNETNKKIVMEYFSDLLKKPKQYEIEKEKTETEINIIEKMNLLMKDFVLSYGGKHVDMSQENITNIDPDQLDKNLWSQIKSLMDVNYSSGMYAQMNQEIVLIFLRMEDEVEFASVLLHEMMHADSFNSITFKNNLDYKNQSIFLNARRIGLSIVNKDGEYFNQLNEAMTEELSARLKDKYFEKFEELQEGLEYRRIIIDENNWDEIDGPVNVRIKKRINKRTGDIEELNMYSIAYEDEREYLNDLIDELYKKNIDMFLDREEVFDVFAKAYFTGNLLSLARLIEKTKGKGSFRKIGEKTMNKRGVGRTLILEEKEGKKTLGTVEQY